MKCRTILIILSMFAALVIAGCGSGTSPGATGGGSSVTASNCVNAACHGAGFSSANSPDIVFAAVSSSSSRTAGLMHIAEVNLGTNFNNPVFKAMTASSKRMPQYVVTGSQCSDCHSHQNVNNKVIREEWAESGHGELTAGPWKGINGKTYGFTDGFNNYTTLLNVNNVCGRCHSKSGFVNFINSNFVRVDRITNGSDKTKEVISCDGCHSDTSVGTVRTVRPFRGFWGYSTVATSSNATNFRGRDLRLPRVTSKYIFTDIGASNVCVPCHVGRNIANSSSYLIKELNVYPQYSTMRLSNTNVALLIGTTGHGYKNYAGPDLGYEIGPASTYTENNPYSHSNIGKNNIAGTGNSGACAGCHMRKGKGHSYSATSVYTDFAICNNCHGVVPVPLGVTTGVMNAPKIATLLEQATDAVKVTQALIARKFINGGATPTAANFNVIKRWYTVRNDLDENLDEYRKRAHYQGAFYNTTYVSNFNFTGSPYPGANLNHNPLYQRRILFDSIDFVVNNRLTGNPTLIEAAINGLAPGYLPDLPAGGRSTALQKENAIKYFSSRP